MGVILMLIHWIHLVTITESMLELKQWTEQTEIHTLMQPKLLWGRGRTDKCGRCVCVCVYLCIYVYLVYLYIYMYKIFLCVTW